MRRETARLAISHFKLNKNLLYSKFWNAQRDLAVQNFNCSLQLSLASH
jgi:hypothetical protein